MGIHQVLVARAAHSAAGSQPPGLFLLAWGLVASAMGLMAVTNFRGFADTIARSSRLKKPPRWYPSQSLNPDGPARLNTTLVRMIGGLFAVSGPIVTVAGIVSSLHGHFTIPQTAALPVPFRYFSLVVGATAVASAWIPRMGGYALSAARRNRWWCAASVLATIGGATFAVCIAYGRPTIGIAAWLASGLLGVALYLSQPRNPHDSDPANRPDDSTWPGTHGEEP